MPSTIRAFEIENYKSIKKSGKIKNNGISLILGPNSSGKTNILESLLLLKQTFENNQFNLRLNGSIIKTGDFVNIIHKQNTNNILRYRFFFQNDLGDQDPGLICPICQKEYTYRGYFTNHLEDKHSGYLNEGNKSLEQFEQYYSSEPYLEISYGYDKEKGSEKLNSIVFGNPRPHGGLHLSSIEIIGGGENTVIKAKSDIGDYEIEFKYNREDDEEDITNNPNFLPRRINEIYHKLAPLPDDDKRVYFYSSLPMKGENREYIEIENKLEKIKDTLEYGEEIENKDDNALDLTIGFISRMSNMTMNHLNKLNRLQSFLDNIHHVGPLRNSPRRIYFGAGGSPGLQAEGRSRVEEKIFSAERSQDRSLINKTNRWLSETGFDCQLEVSPVGVGDLYQMEVTQEGLAVNLADAGFGLSQTLPIIVECVSMQMGDDSSQASPRLTPYRLGRHAEEAPLGLIEQPEIHLNPRIEASLGDFFIEVMKSDVNLMIETHSEHLLNRLQRRIADGSIDDPNNIVIYFISKEEGVSEINEIQISSSGSFSEWPDGFFQEDFEDAIEILKESIDQ